MKERGVSGSALKFGSVDDGRMGFADCLYRSAKHPLPPINEYLDRREC